MYVKDTYHVGWVHVRTRLLHNRQRRSNECTRSNNDFNKSACNSLPANEAYAHSPPRCREIIEPTYGSPHRVSARSSLTHSHTVYSVFPRKWKRGKVNKRSRREGGIQCGDFLAWLLLLLHPNPRQAMRISGGNQRFFWLQRSGHYTYLLLPLRKSSSLSLPSVLSLFRGYITCCWRTIIYLYSFARTDYYQRKHAINIHFLWFFAPLSFLSCPTVRFVSKQDRRAFILSLSISRVFTIRRSMIFILPV